MAINVNMRMNEKTADMELQTGRFGTVSISGRKQDKENAKAGSLMLNGQFDPIKQKKAFAKKQAYKIVKDALASELKMDANVQEYKDHAEKLQADMDRAQEEIRKIDDRKESLRIENSVEEDSAEQRDLELLEKRAAYEDAVNRAQNGIIADNAVIRGTRLERLKKDYIRKAQNEKDDMLAAAGREIMGMLVEEAKDHVDEKSGEIEEKAEEKRAEKEEQQQKLDAAKEKREEMESLADAGNTSKENTTAAKPVSALKDPLTETVVQLDTQREDYQREIEEMMRRMNLMTEDIKGIKVDETF